MFNKANLSENELEELMRRYYSGEKNSVLIEEFRLDVKVNQIHTLFPLIKRNDLLCHHCQVHMVQKPLAKSATNYQRKDNTAYCEQCGHINDKYCRCKYCEDTRVKQAEKLNNKKIAFICSSHKPRRLTPIDIAALPLIDALSLVSLARAALNEKSNIIVPLKFHTLSFCIRESTTLSVLEKLYEADLIEVSLDSDLRSISLCTENNPIIDIGLVSWAFKLGKTTDESLMILESLERIFRTKSEWPAHWLTEIPFVWRELALEEVLSYFELKLNEHKFYPRVGEKTRKVFNSLLQVLPISKIYNLIWVSVTNAAAYHVRSNISKQQAANSIIGNCQKRAERALNEQWDLKDYKKDYQIPESTRISIFANVLTDLGNSFYSEIAQDNSNYS